MTKKKRSLFLGTNDNIMRLASIYSYCGKQITTYTVIQKLQQIASTSEINCVVMITAVSRKVVGKGTRDNPFLEVAV